jgi:PKD repeat protein
MASLLAVWLLLWSPSALGGDEDFLGIEGRPVAMNVTVEPGGPVDTWHWDFEGDGCFTWSSAFGPNATHTFEEPGLYYPVLKATNGSATVNTWIFQALIEPANEPPQVAVPEEYREVLRGETVAFTGTAIDDGSVVLYEWDFDGDGEADHESATTASATWAFSGVGEHVAVLRATDDEGASSTATVTVLVLNQPPTVSSRHFWSDEIIVNISVSASDQDGDVVSYIWDLGEGFDNITTTEPSIQVSLPSTGEHRVNVTVVDNDGATASTVVRIERRAPLQEVFASANPEEVYIGRSIIFEVEVIGEYWAPYTVTWHLGDGNVSTDWNVEHTYSTAGTYRIEVRTINNNNVMVSDNLTVRVLWRPNTPPVAVPSVEQWVLPGRNLRFSDASYDPDGTIVLWQWDFEGDGTYDHSNTTSGNHTHVYTEEGHYTAVLRVTDDRGAVGIATAVIKVDRDAPGEDPIDDSQGAAVCCGVLVVILVAVAYWAVRRSLATPRKDGGPVEERSDGEGGEGKVSEEEGTEPPSGD